MHEARLIRTLRFTARHHYRRSEWSEEENRRVFGDQVEPHEHDWSVEVHVVAPVDASTGWAVDLSTLDQALSTLTDGWDGGDLNQRVPPVRDGRLTPSTENLARWLYEALSARLPPPARVSEVRVYESPELGSAYPG